MEWRSVPAANRFLRVTRGIVPFFKVRISSLALTREIISFFEVQITSCAFPRETIPFLKAKHLNALNSPAPPSLKLWRHSQATRPINRTLIVLLSETSSSLFRRFVYDSSPLLKQRDWGPWSSGDSHSGYYPVKNWWVSAIQWLLGSLSLLIFLALPAILGISPLGLHIWLTFRERF